MRPVVRRRRAAVALALLTSCKPSPPPIDFQGRDDVPPAPSDAAGAARDAGPAFRPRDGVAVPGDGRTLTLAGKSASPPPGQRFAAMIPWDYDRDGTDEALFVARVTDAGDAAGVSLVRPVGDSLEVAGVIGPEPEDPTCAIPHFRQTSARSLVLTWRCPPTRPPGGDGGPRGVFASEVVLMGPIGNDTGFRARAGVLRDPLPDTAIELTAEGVDTDGDGSDELVVQVAAGRPGAAPGARARLVYFARGSQFVWDTTEPAASLRATIDALRRRAGVRRSAAAVLPAVDDLARLRRALCQDGGIARVKLPGGVGVRCAPDPFEGAAEAALRAYVTLGELPAAWALTRAATAHPLGVVPFSRVRSALEGASRPQPGVSASLSPALHASSDVIAPLRFPIARWESAREPVTALLLGEHAARVRRADWTALDAPDLAGSAQTLPMDLSRTRRLGGLAWAPTGLAALLCAADDAACANPDRRIIPLLPPADLGADPSVSRPYVGADAQVMGWGAEGLVLSVRGRVWRVPPAGDAVPLAAGERWTGSFPEGQAITEDGRVAALAAPEGVWVHEGASWRRLLPDALRERAGEVRDLNPSADGLAILARLADNGLAVIERPRAARR